MSAAGRVSIRKRLQLRIHGSHRHRAFTALRTSQSARPAGPSIHPPQDIHPPALNTTTKNTQSQFPPCVPVRRHPARRRTSSRRHHKPSHLTWPGRPALSPIAVPAQGRHPLRPPVRHPPRQTPRSGTLPANAAVRHPPRQTPRSGTLPVKRPHRAQGRHNSMSVLSVSGVAAGLSGFSFGVTPGPRGVHT